MSTEKFIPNRAAFITLVAACLVVIISLGVRQTFGLFFFDFEIDLGVTRTQFGFAIGLQLLLWGLFGPLFGIMIADFYFIQKGNLNNKDIYSLENNSAYYYTGGWHIKGVYSLLLGFIFSASTIWNNNLMFLQSYSWIIGAFVAAFVYYLLARK